MPRGVHFGDAEGNITILDLDDVDADVNDDDDNASDGSYRQENEDEQSVETALSEYVDEDEMEEAEAQQLAVDDTVIDLDTGVNTAAADDRFQQDTARGADDRAEDSGDREETIPDGGLEDEEDTAADVEAMEAVEPVRNP